MSAEAVSRLMARADRALKDADILAADQRYSSAISRAYYAAFYAAEAALLAQEVAVKSHKGVVAAFGKQLILTGHMSGQQGRTLQLLNNLRQQSDYAIFSQYGQEDAMRAMAMATTIVQSVSRFLDQWVSGGQ